VITRDYVLSLFWVDVTSGEMIWRNPPWNHSEKLGRLAGNAQPTRNGKVYWVVSIDGRKHKRSRLIFLVAHGRLPTPCVDHINGNSLDDRIENLREATITQNAWNHRSRTKKQDLPMGVRLIPNSGRYQARIAVNGTMYHLGAYDTPDEARAAYLAARQEYYGEYA
jgi:hypothetical protein